MTVTTRKTMKVKTPFLILPLALLLLAGLAFVACDQGSSPTPPMGITGTDELLFDDPQPGVTARVSPSAIGLPGTASGGDALATLVGMYRDPAGMPVEGLQMNFTADPTSQVSSGGGALSFNPVLALTDANGAASTEVRVNVDAPAGSYILVAYTSPASAGPNAEGQTTLRIATAFETLRITTSTLGGPYQSDTTDPPAPPIEGSGTFIDVPLEAIGGVPPYSWVVTGLPLNVTLATDRIQGYILVPGTYAVSVTATDTVGATATASFSLTGF
jgi:hypothetical protein